MMSLYAKRKGILESPSFTESRQSKIRTVLKPCVSYQIIKKSAILVTIF